VGTNLLISFFTVDMILELRAGRRRSSGKVTMHISTQMIL
jgi:hypothetical protein